MTRDLHATFLAALILFSLSSPVSAENPVSNAKGEFGFLTGYGTSHVGFGETRHQIQTWDAIARAGFFLSDDVGKGSW